MPTAPTASPAAIDAARRLLTDSVLVDNERLVRDLRGQIRFVNTLDEIDPRLPELRTLIAAKWSDLLNKLANVP
jgi:hypothetical protein